MRIEFKTGKLQKLAEEEKGAKHFPPAVVDEFFYVLGVIGAAKDERDIRSLKSLRLHKLKGNRKGQYALNLNKQFRLTMTFEKDADGKYVCLIAIEDYH